LHDIEACLAAQSAKLYHMGLREPVRRSTLTDSNETRDWRIDAEFAQRLITKARRMYADDDLEVDLYQPLQRVTHGRRPHRHIGGGRHPRLCSVHQRKVVDADPSLRLGQALRRHDGEWRVESQSFGRLVSVFVLVAIVRKRLRLEVSLYTFLQLFLLTVFEKIPTQSTIFPTPDRFNDAENSNQLEWFTS
jgi:hypothetical protein